MMQILHMTVNGKDVEVGIDPRRLHRSGGRNSH